MAPALSSPALPTSLVTGASLPLGFLVAQASGVRVLGGLLLLGVATWGALRWRAMAGTQVALLLAAGYGVAFVLAHVIAPVTGAVPAVVTVGAAFGLLAYVLVKQRSAASEGPRRAQVHQG